MLPRRTEAKSRQVAKPVTWVPEPTLPIKTFTKTEVVLWGTLGNFEGPMFVLTLYKPRNRNSGLACATTTQHGPAEALLRSTL